MKIKVILVFFFLISILSLPGCNVLPECACTEIFLMQMVDLADSSHQPLTDASVTITFVDSGREIDCSPYHDDSNGAYCIMNDSFVKQLNMKGKLILVKFEKSGFQTHFETYLFNTDICKCHINLIDGPTTVVLQSI